MSPVTLPAFHTPVIRGGSPAEQRLLARIVRRTRPTQIRTLKIQPVSGDWHPNLPGDVELIASTTRIGRRRDNMLGEWETSLVGGAFRDRSVALGLPRVLVVGDGSGAQRAEGGPHAMPARVSGLPAFHRRVEAIASRSGARIVNISTGVPDGYSARVTLQVANPVRFLLHRLPALQSGLARLGSDGVWVSLYEADGRPLYVSGGSLRLSSGEGWVPDARYAPCVQMGMGGPFTLAPPLPCPSTWRPPPSTPPKRLAIHGWAAGGTAERGSDRGGDRIAYLPGTTLGLGFTLENPNGHAVTVEAITPAVPASAPIRHTGARIQIPPSRATRSAELQRPFSPERPFAPFTIKPGDWVNIGLHYAIARCTPATAGRTVTENRRLAITYVLQGKTHTATYANTPYTISVPATCPG